MENESSPKINIVRLAFPSKQTATRAQIAWWDINVNPCCPINREEEETIDHMLVLCSFARTVWNLHRLYF